MIPVGSRRLCFRVNNSFQSVYNDNRCLDRLDVVRPAFFPPSSPGSPLPQLPPPHCPPPPAARHTGPALPTPSLPPRPLSSSAPTPWRLGFRNRGFLIFNIQLAILRDVNVSSLASECRAKTKRLKWNRRRFVNI